MISNSSSQIFPQKWTVQSGTVAVLDGVLLLLGIRAHVFSMVLPAGSAFPHISPAIPFDRLDNVVCRVLNSTEQGDMQFNLSWTFLCLFPFLS